jgi:non-specific serine/threonine protein kinase/serine/threonine-protein kinase PknK
VHLIEQALKLGREANDRLNVSMCLQTLAWVAIDGKEARRAAVLMGASEEMSRSVGSSTVRLPGLTAYQDACEREVERLLSKRELATARKKGHALTFRAAVEYALNEQDSHTRFRSAGPSTQPTKRELEVAALIAEGLTDKEMAARLVISPRTVHGHVEHLLVKLGFNSRTQIAAWFTESKSGR